MVSKIPLDFQRPERNSAQDTAEEMVTQDGEGRDKLAKRAFPGRVRSHESSSGASGTL